MTLGFTKPEIKQERLKILIYGGIGSGKSTMACSFPNTAYIDTEDIMSKVKYSKLIEQTGGLTLSTKSLDKILDRVEALARSKHDFKTVVIDSLTVAYNQAKTDAEVKVGAKFGADSKVANKKIRELCLMLLDVDMNVIITCRAKKEYGRDMAVIGQTWDGYDGLGYLFDLVLETSVLGCNFSAVIKKSRLEGFNTGDEIDFSYEEVIRRCGVGVLERPVDLKPEAMTAVTPASNEQIDELNKLINLTSTGAELVSKWLIAAKCDRLEEMPAESAEKCIKFLERKLIAEEQ